MVKQRKTNNNTTEKKEEVVAESSTQPVELNPKTVGYEFGGPLGALGMIVGLPIAVMTLSVSCGATGYPAKELLVDWKSFVAQHLTMDFLNSLLDPWAFLFYSGFVFLLAILYPCLPSDMIPGTRLRDGTIKKYKNNAFTSFHATFFIFLYWLKDKGLKPLDFVYDHFNGLAFASIVFSFVLSFAVYFGSFGKKKLLALGGNTGNPIYDFMIGRELNPSIGDFDIKYFIELRPGLIGWITIDICLAAKQYNDLGYVSNALCLVLFFQTWYVMDALWNEEAILTTMDITTDGFGFMLAFGLLSWVPFTYTLQARYLVDFPRSISWVEFGAIFALHFLGYYIFRSANSQKNEFRSYPNSPTSKKTKYLQTKAGTKLITSGWWGKSRHINYFGDWLMALSYSLPCGFGSPIPYFYPFYFAILLIHRERRDDHKCRVKYGEDWEKYCKLVKYRIIPGVY